MRFLRFLRRLFHRKPRLKMAKGRPQFPVDERYLVKRGDVNDIAPGYGPKYVEWEKQRRSRRAGFQLSDSNDAVLANGQAALAARGIDPREARAK